MKDMLVEEVVQSSNDGNGQIASEDQSGKSFQCRNVDNASSSRNARRRKSSWHIHGG
jgi:hypothetical protein